MSRREQKLFLKKRSDSAMWWDMVLCRIKREQSLDMACDWQIFEKNCRSICRKQGQGRRARPLEFTSRIMQGECSILYWLLVSMQRSFSSKQAFSVRKDSGKTSHIERFNLTLRQRVSRLGRKTLSFSKNMKNHIGAVWNFIHHYNENIAPNLATTPWGRPKFNSLIRLSW